ncbi:tetratricopeptide repeat protein [Candidatus Electronema sp. JC]|uniref:tetratricopeptide repeat protein n=1 Tax=Candidatus Electronema sp. JC TaxID=3401570 RepID=UPI003B43568E
MGYGYKELGDKAGEGRTLNNISQIYDARGDYPAALTYLEQSLRIMQRLATRQAKARR